MSEYRGWLFDLYPAEQGLTLWLLDDEGPRRQLWMPFPTRFYAAGPAPRLRQAWQFLQPQPVQLARTRRRDLFSGELDLLQIEVPKPVRLPLVFQDLQRAFPDLDYYDADIPFSLRFEVRHGVHLLGRCRIECEQQRVIAIEALDSPWELDPAAIPLRILELSPDSDPLQGSPSAVQVRYRQGSTRLQLEPSSAFLAGVRAILRRFDPDLILSEHGDGWLFPLLADLGCNPNRDPGMQPLQQRASSYVAYGQVIHRAQQTHLFGRWHIDRRNALLFGEIGLEGALELARVSGLGVQEAARKSPGAGITAMQMRTALQMEVLVPFVKQQAERRKSLADLIAADRGGLIYQPLVGVHRHVAQIDFASMYPSIMVQHNISPESEHDPTAEPGLVPRTLQPLVHKRLQLKEQLLALDPHDCRTRALQQRQAALKWLLVVCFGYLGYKNARFGRIEAHEAVTGISRELMLQAKETAEQMGFTVLHMYVDSLFVQREGLQQPADFLPLLQAVHERTGIPITLEGIYRWLVFPPSRQDARLPVPNRYFGVFANGELKARGIAVRRHDTCRFVAAVQWGALQRMAKEEDPRRAAGQVQSFVRQQLSRLRRGQVALEDLRVARKLSRALDAYRVPSPAALAAAQLQADGVVVQPGMRIHFWFVREGVKVRGVQPHELDLVRYRRLVELALTEVLLETPTAQPSLPGWQKVTFVS